jgi:glycosyltransferase involved in cell wall biosynthesis
MDKDTVSVILTVYNQENIIQEVLNGILDNISDITKELIIILDGCTDGSESQIDKLLPKARDKNLDIKIIFTDNVNEVRANNVGLKNSTCEYSILVQDDCKIIEKDFDKRMLKPFKVIPNLLAVSGRDAVDVRIWNGEIDYYNLAGVDANTPRNIFSIRDGFNRSPVMIDNAKMKEMNYFSDDFAPLESDDVELGLRAYKTLGYVVGSYVVEYYSPSNWGSTRSNLESNRIWELSMIKNKKLIIDRPSEFIAQPKHSVDMVIE